MKKAICFLMLFTIAFGGVILAQDSLEFSIHLKPLSIQNLPGLHSYVHGESNKKWLIVGGRLDGLHARQPFNAFPAAGNNKSMFVVDPITKNFWSHPLSNLPVNIQEQLQSTNMNFEQVGDTLYIIGGYAFSTSKNNHITFPYLTTIRVSKLIEAISNGDTAISSYFKQIENAAFAVTGGHLAVINDTFLIVGGHRFDGRYNPMGNPTYTQNYTNQIRRVLINNANSQIQVTILPAITNEIHLHRRDYNLIPRINGSNQIAYTISSGVFQTNANLPFLYPVDITGNSITPITSFNQYLSNYHSAVASIYKKSTQTQFHLFFGGMSQYYYNNNELITDNNVPFTKTISMLKRTSDTLIEEIKMPIEMPGLKGSSSEFIKNREAPYLFDEFVDFDEITNDSLTIGYIYGGISSSTINPFTNNATANTQADNIIYEVVLIKNKKTTGIALLKSLPTFKTIVYPNPADKNVLVNLNLPESGIINIMWLSMGGQLLTQEKVKVESTTTELKLTIPELEQNGPLMLVINLNNKFYASHKIQRKVH